ncbi:MAG: flagellar filament capping protein FliD [Acidobacteriota bacterium]
MSSPITFSGFNNIDFNTVLNSLMQAASQPLTDLQDRQTALKTQVSQFDTLNSRLSSLRSAADALASLSSVSTVSGTSTDTAVTVATGTGAVAGHYDVVVNELARAQVTASTTTAPDATTTVVASGGTLTIGGVDVAISGDVTLQQLATAINQTDGIGVTAAVIRTGTNAYKLALSSVDTGLANAFTVTNGLTGGTGIAFGANAVNASDASILINNIAATNSSNTFVDIAPGLTLTVSKKDAAKTIGIDVAADSSALSDKVNGFISAYNDLVKFIDTQRTAANNGDTGSIGRDPLLRGLRNSLRTELLGVYGSASLQRLTEVGVEFTREGTLALNQSKFDEAVNTNGDDVRNLFAGTGGAFPAIESLIDGYSQTGGVIPGVKDRLNQQVASMDDQISKMQARLAQQRLAMQQEFTAADAAMSQLKSQSSSLSSIGSGLGSF